MSKLYAGENAVWITDQAIQILSGYGYIRDHPVERGHRDAQGLHALRGHLGDLAADHRRRPVGHPDQLAETTADARDQGFTHIAAHLDGGWRSLLRGATSDGVHGYYVSGGGDQPAGTMTTGWLA
jgi:hypothetical protein